MLQKDLSILLDRITTLSNQKNVSINKMLLDCGLSKSVVDNIKKGSIPTIDKIQKIAEYFNVSTDYLLGKTENPTTQKNGEVEDPMTAEMVRLMEKLSSKEQEFALEHLRSLVALQEKSKTKS